MEIVDLVKSVIEIGLPAVLCLYLVWNNTNREEKFAEKLKELSDIVAENTRQQTETSTLISELSNEIREIRNLIK